jgi:hypothetical protein
VKRTVGWSHGILIAMLGIVFVVIGIMQALMLPMRGVMNWAITASGVVGFFGGVIVALNAKIDRSLPANEKRIPSARVHRSARR